VLTEFMMWSLVRVMIPAPVGRELRYISATKIETTVRRLFVKKLWRLCDWEYWHQLPVEHLTFSTAFGLRGFLLPLIKIDKVVDFR
jgi:hypothetical protein